MTEAELNQVVEKIAKREKTWQMIIAIVGTCFTIAATVASFMFANVNDNVDEQNKDIKELKAILGETNKKIAIMTHEHVDFEEDLSEAIEQLDVNQDEHSAIILRLDRLER